MQLLRTASTKSLCLTTIAFIVGLATYNWVFYGKALQFWLPAVIILILSVFLAYFIKREIEVRKVPLLAFGILQQISGALTLSILFFVILIYKLVNGTNDVPKDSLLVIVYLLYKNIFLEWYRII